MYPNCLSIKVSTVGGSSKQPSVVLKYPNQRDMGRSQHNLNLSNKHQRLKIKTKTQFNTDVFVNP